MTDINVFVRENVKKLTPYSCARDEFSGDSAVFLDANENPYGKLNRYPDPHQRKLKYAISKIKGIDEEKIFLGNGSDEIIDICFRVFCNPGTDKVLTLTPTYGMYEVSASINDIKVDVENQKEELINKIKHELSIITYKRSKNPKSIRIKEISGYFNKKDFKSPKVLYKTYIVITMSNSDKIKAKLSVYKDENENNIIINLNNNLIYNIDNKKFNNEILIDKLVNKYKEHLLTNYKKIR